MWNRYAAVGITVLMTMSARVVAQEPSGECELKNPIQITAKPKGKGEKTKLKRGTRIEITGKEGTWLLVVTDSTEGYAPAKVIKKNCVPITDAPAGKEEPGQATPGASPAPGPAPAPAAEPALAPAAEPAPSPATAPAPAADANQPIDQQWATTQKTRIAVFESAIGPDIPSGMAASTGATVIRALNDTGSLMAISSQDVEKMLGPKVKNEALACKNPKCQAEIGLAFGADHVLMAQVSHKTNGFNLTLKLIATKNAQVVQEIVRMAAEAGPPMDSAWRAAAQEVVSGFAPVAVASASEASSEPALVVVAPDDPTTPARRVRFLAWSAITVGAAALVAGGTLFAIKTAEQNAEQTADQSTYFHTGSSQTQTSGAVAALNLAALSAFAAGAVLLGTGIAVRLMSDEPGPAATTTTSTGKTDQRPGKWAVSLLPNGIAFAATF